MTYVLHLYYQMRDTPSQKERMNMTYSTKKLLLTETSNSLLDKITYYMEQVDVEHAKMLLGIKTAVKHIFDNMQYKEFNEETFEAIAAHLTSYHNTMWDIVLDYKY